MKRALALVACLSLAACGTYVAQGTVDYNEAIEAETNQLLVINILRARDGVPTYYSDISQVRGTMSMGLQDSSLLGIAAIGKSTTRNSTSPNPSVQVSPSFDVAPLNTQEFTRGITEPLEISVMQYYLDRGIPPDVLLYLLIDKIEVVKTAADGQITVDRYYNIPCSSGSTQTGPCDTSSGVDQRFHDKVQAWIPYVILNAYTLMEPYGPPSTAKSAAAAAKPAGGPGGGGGAGNAGASQMTLRPIGGGLYEEFLPSDRIAFCVPVATNWESQQDIDALRKISITLTPTPFKTTDKLKPLYKEASDAPHVFQIVAVPHTTVAGSPQAIADIPDPTACVRNLIYVKPSDLLEGVPSGMASATGASRKSAPPRLTPERGMSTRWCIYARSTGSLPISASCCA